MDSLINSLYLDFENYLLANISLDSKLFLGYSGGVDSEIMAHLLSKFNQQYKSVKCCLVHVNHGLHEDADLWEQHCIDRSIVYSLPLEICKVKIVNKPRCSLEDLARQARYNAIFNLMDSSSVLLTAHHADDQLETILLALKRGSGLQGLAGISQKSYMKNKMLLRPILHTEKQDLLNIAAANNLPYVVDSSNLDDSFDRNFLRNNVLPLLKKRWPFIAKTASRTAKVLDSEKRATNILIDEKIDLMQHENKLDLNLMASYPLEIKQLFIRRFLQKQNAVMPSEAVLQQIIKQGFESKKDAKPVIKWHDNEINFYKNCIYFSKIKVFDFNQEIPLGKLQTNVVYDFKFAHLIASPASSGLNPDILNDNLVIRFGLPMSFKCFPSFKSKACSFKKIAQELDIPVFKREKIPLLFSGNNFVAALGFWVEKHFFVYKNGVYIIFNVY